MSDEQDGAEFLAKQEAEKAETEKNAREFQEKVKKDQEERMEKIVVEARKVLPLITEANRSVYGTKVLLDTLAVTLQQGIYYIMRENTVAKLDLKAKIDKSFPDYEIYIPILTLIEDLPLDLATETLQWLNEKIKATQKIEDQARDFKDLGINLD